jgi:hypothetical protein
MEWLSLEESSALVRHWVEDLGAEKWGQLALITPGAGAEYGEFPLHGQPDWLIDSRGEVYVTFSEYRQIGVARCAWQLIVDNLTALALADGDGFAAVTEELGGVLIVDLEVDDGAQRLEITAWGDLLTRSGSNSDVG